MPIIKSAIKRVKQAAKRRDQNVTTKKQLKAAVKEFLLAPSASGLSEVQSALDTAVKKKVLEKNTAARRKAQFSKIAKEAGVKAGDSKKAAPKAAAKTSAKAEAKPAAKKPVAKPATKAPAKKPAAKKPTAKKTAK